MSMNKNKNNKKRTLYHTVALEAVGVSESEATSSDHLLKKEGEKWK